MDRMSASEVVSLADAGSGTCSLLPRMQVLLVLAAAVIYVILPRCAQAEGAGDDHALVGSTVKLFDCLRPCCGQWSTSDCRAASSGAGGLQAVKCQDNACTLVGSTNKVLALYNYWVNAVPHDRGARQTRGRGVSGCSARPRVRRQVEGQCGRRHLPTSGHATDRRAKLPSR